MTRSRIDAVCTLMTAQDNPIIDDALVSQVLSTIEANAQTVLSPNVAIDIAFRTDDLEASDKMIRTAIGRHAVDVVVQTEENREKKLLIADMDSTIIQQECLDELASYAGLKDKVAEITERAMRGELDFADALRSRVAMLQDLPLTKLQETLDNNISLTPGAVELVRTMNNRGAMTALVSGGFTFFTHRIAQATGFQDNQGNILGMVGNTLNGTVEEPILGREAKEEALYRLCEDEGISAQDALAVGDGANDLMMLAAAGTGVAFHAKPAVADAAKVQINHADLRALLYLQGIAASDFVTS